MEIIQAVSEGIAVAGATVAIVVIGVLTGRVVYLVLFSFGGK